MTNPTSAPPADKDPINQEIEAAIDPWLAHMRWRKDYDKWRKGRIWQETKQDDKLAVLREHVGALDGLRVLDLGCGMGGLTVAMARSGAVVQPMDFEPDYCRITRLRGQRYDLDLQPVNAAGESLPFADHSFDLITCMDVLEHVQVPAQVLAEAKRVLVPGGLLYITAINRFAWNDPHYHLRGVNWLPGSRTLADRYVAWRGRDKEDSNCQDKQLLSEMHYYTYGGVLRLAGQAGFTVAELGEELMRAHTGPLYRRGGVAGRAIGLADSAGLLPYAYRAYRFAWKGTYQLLMRAPGSNEAGHGR